MFNLVKIENGRQNVGETVFLEVTASEAITKGEALVVSSGKLTKCGATAKPKYIALRDLSATATNRVIGVDPVTPGCIFETTFSATPTSLVVGSVVTLHTDGLQVTATTTSGVATIVNMLGATASGDKVAVKFE